MYHPSQYHLNRIALSLAFISCLSLFACTKKKETNKNKAIPVSLYTLKEKTVLYYDSYPATTAALSQVSLLAQVQGYITNIYFKEGSHVVKGQKLYEIDTRLYQANFDAAVANLKVADGNLRQAQQDEDRYEYLNKYNAVAKQQYDHAVITLQNAKSSQKAAADAVKTARTNLSYAVIKAPFTGTIGFSQVKIGNVVTNGQTVLNTISTDDPMAVDFLVNEKNIMKFEKLSKAKQAPADSLFTLLMPDNTLYNFIGKIYVIDRAVDSQTGSIRVRLIFQNPQDYLKVGMSCIVRVHNQDRGPQIVVPGKAVTEQMGEYFVFTAKDTIVSRPDPKDKSKKIQKHELAAFQRKVQVGQTVGPNQVIKSGLKAGDRIITDGIQSLHDGAEITTANVEGPSAPGKGGRGK